MNFNEKCQIVGGDSKGEYQVVGSNFNGECQVVGWNFNGECQVEEGTSMGSIK